ncbi:MAG: MFS transporter [Nannocystis sp.]|nr:MFS transporter [Nannocystis sp.]
MTAPSGLIRWRDRGVLGFIAAATLGPIASMALRFVPAELERGGAGPLVIGEVMAASTLGGVLLLPLAGRLARARLRALLIAGALFQAGGLALAGATGATPGALALAVAVLSVGTAMIDVGVMTAVVGQVAAPARPQILAYYFILVNLARNVVGSAIAEALTIAASFGAMCLAFAGLAAAHALARALLPLPAAVAAPRPPAAALHADLRRPRVVLLVLILVLLGVHHVAQESFLSALAAQRTIASVTPFFTAYALVVLAGRVVAGHRVDRIGRGRVVVVSALALVVVGLGLAAVDSVALLTLLGALTGAGHALLWPALYATLYDKVRDHAGLSAALSGCLALAGLAAELGLGWLAIGGGYAAIYLTVAGAALVAALVAAPLAPWMAPEEPA